ncbi:speckle-type POZ protein-like [Leptopilina boulardi]|uniref:speckle-type POZ protein-like n=1 Tax=Leptopilina boulardi TaxID=63433 RepID=UPI0021F67956|nr:speckle-type POZ protein-like [Leptopilina boulardi]
MASRVKKIVRLKQKTEKDAKDIQKSQGVTDINWIIKNCNYDDIHSYDHTSSPFEIEGIPNKKWYIQFFKTNYDSFFSSKNSERKYIRFLLYNESNYKHNFDNQVKIKIIFGIVPKKKVFSKITNSIAHYEILIEEDELTQFITNARCLHVNLKIKPLRDVEKFSTVGNNFLPFLNNNNLSDVVFQIENEVIPAHKLMLASVSPVFDSMFAHQMRENITNIVQIENADPNAFKEMLRYIYTGEIENLKNVVFGLYELADKYDITKLRLICEEFFERCLSIDNVIGILEHADRHNSQDLKNECIVFIDRNFDKVGNTDAFRNMHKDLLLDFIFTTKTLNNNIKAERNN